jgi:atypical dual specificity phosphatase
MGQLFSNDCQEVVRGLYIGHIGTAKDPLALAKYGITRVVDVSAQPYDPPPGVTVLRLPIPDVSTYDIRQIFGLTNAFIVDALRDGCNVLVHCHWGISRSATVVLAFLLAFHHHLTLEQSLILLQSKRSVINPNQGFRRMLALYEQELVLYRRQTKNKGDTNKKNDTNDDDDDGFEE